MVDYVNYIYTVLCNNSSDINEHLPTLYLYAKECESVFETGVRGCISSWALTKGLLENGKSNKSLFMNDISPCDINELLSTTKDLPIKMDYKWINNLQLELPDRVDLTFIDTWHIYGQLKRELDKFSKVTNKYIIMHDTTVDGVYGETIRNGWDAEKQSQETGFSIEEITCGLQKAIDEFLVSHPEWVVDKVYTNNNGLTILRRI
jgi:hypothetical protein